MFNENVFKMVSMIFINQIHMSHFEFRFFTLHVNLIYQIF